MIKVCHYFETLSQTTVLSEYLSLLSCPPDKYTGLPIWGSGIHPIAALVPSVDGKSIMATGWYWGESNEKNMGNHFDSVALPDYNGIEGGKSFLILFISSCPEFITDI